jgi:hypothetical protein
MQVMWMVLVTLGLALGGDPGARGGIPGNRLGQAPVTSHRPVLCRSVA